MQLIPFRSSAVAAADIEWHADPVPDFKALDSQPDFLDLAEILMPENPSLFEVCRLRTYADPNRKYWCF